MQHERWIPPEEPGGVHTLGEVASELRRFLIVPETFHKYSVQRRWTGGTSSSIFGKRPGAVRKKLSVASSLVLETSPTTEMPVPASAQNSWFWNGGKVTDSPGLSTSFVPA